MNMRTLSKRFLKCAKHTLQSNRLKGFVNGKALKPLVFLFHQERGGDQVCQILIFKSIVYFVGKHVM